MSEGFDTSDVGTPLPPAITNYLRSPYQGSRVPEGQALMTITQGDTDSPVGPSTVLRDILAEVAAADHGLAVQLAPIVVDQRQCAFCDPTRPSGVVVATIAIINRFDRLIRRTVCAGCVHDAVVWGLGESRDVTIRAAIGAVL